MRAKDQSLEVHEMLVSVILCNCSKNRYSEILTFKALTKWHVNTAVCNWSKINEESTVVA